MFNRLRNKIIIITMVATTAVLLLAGGSVMFFSSALRPEPEIELVVSDVMVSADPVLTTSGYDQDLTGYIKDDREAGDLRLMMTLISVGLAIEIIVFVIVYYLSEKIVAPVEEAYNKQRLFIANASHELKTPLAVIQANMEAMEVSRSNQKWKDNVETEVTRANKLVLDLLRLAKMDAGKISKNEAERIILDAELKKRIEAFRPKFGGKISLRVQGKKEYILPKQDVLQVMDILLDNATKYGKEKVSVVLAQGRIEVANDGAKISKTDQAKIFDRFYQADKTREGSGLGLAIAQAICERNGWRIGCKSSERLTKFIVNFTK